LCGTYRNTWLQVFISFSSIVTQKRILIIKKDNIYIVSSKLWDDVTVAFVNSTKMITTFANPNPLHYHLRNEPRHYAYTNLGEPLSPPELPQQTKESFVRFEVFIAVTMKKGVFWVVTPCGSCKNRRFGGT
jgi:hypothetical protein